MNKRDEFALHTIVGFSQITDALDALKPHFESLFGNDKEQLNQSTVHPN